MLKTVLYIMLLPFFICASASDDDNSCDRSTLTKPGRISSSHGVMRVEGTLTITYTKDNEWCTYLKHKKKYIYRHPLPEIKRQAFIAERFAALERLLKGKSLIDQNAHLP